MKQSVRDAADAWARGHGCRDILSCSQTPLAAFEAGMAAERERLQPELERIERDSLTRIEELARKTATRDNRQD